MSSRKPAALARRVLSAAKHAAAAPDSAKVRCPLKELLLGVLSDDMPGRSALIALNRLERFFVDWNEVRVSSPHEVAGVMNSGRGEVKAAERVCTVLARVFDKANDLSLAFLAEKTPRDVARLVARFAAVSNRARPASHRAKAAKPSVAAADAHAATGRKKAAVTAGGKKSARSAAAKKAAISRIKKRVKKLTRAAGSKHKGRKERAKTVKTASKARGAKAASKRSRSARERKQRRR